MKASRIAFSIIGNRAPILYPFVEQIEHSKTSIRDEMLLYIDSTNKYNTI